MSLIFTAKAISDESLIAEAFNFFGNDKHIYEILFFSPKLVNNMHLMSNA